MIKRTRTLKANREMLPFPEWVNKMFPEKNLKRKLLRAIGALDLAYLIYRLNPPKSKPVTTEHSIAPIRQAAQKTAGSDADTFVRTPPKRKRVAKKILEKTDAPEVKLEFKKTKPEPLPALDELTTEIQKPEPVREPEPLIFEEAEPEKPVITEPVWFDDPRLDEQDIKKTDLPLGIDGITISFDAHTVDDEHETVITVDGTSYRAMLISPEMNLSAMLQVARVTSGELYVLGRAALGAISGEGHISSEETSRIVHMLKDAGNTIDIDIEYSAKPKHIRNRTVASMKIRFVRVDD
jgi:hypothetical protein